MSHEIETMAWAGAKPWHSLGFNVSNDLTAEEMMIASKTDWTVSKVPSYIRLNGEEVELDRAALVRNSDNTILDVVSGDWNPTQNTVAFEFFKEFVDAGNMTMETAGSLKNGKIVWVLAKINKGFDLFNGDRVEGYLLFTNPHRYGQSIDVRFTATRVVCNNTLTAALNSNSLNMVKVSHRVLFKPEAVKETIGLAEKKLDLFKEQMEFLGSKQYEFEQVMEYIGEVFPSQSTVENGLKKNRNAEKAILALTHQPGIEFAPGSWWQALNAVTYTTDHLMGRTDEARVYNSWYGANKDLKVSALKKALDYASRA